MTTDAERLAELVADIAEQPSWTFTLLGESNQAVTITISARDRDCLVAALRSSPGRDIRAEIIEECAAVAEQYDHYTADGRPSAVGTVIATALRGLKSQSSGPRST